MRRLPVLLLLGMLGCDNRQAGGGTRLAPRVSQSFPAAGVTRVVLRASAAAGAEVTTDRDAADIEVSGRPIGGAEGYHSPDPNWRETPAADWGLGFEAQRHGAVLVVSTKKEILYIHHHYVLTSLRVRVPAGVRVVREV